MADLFLRKENRFRKLASSEAEIPGIKPWMGIEFTEMSGLPVKKLYVTNGEYTYEIIKQPQMGGGPFEYQILQEITQENHPFLLALIKDEVGRL